MPGGIHDAAADFSATQNPAGPWSYGYTAPSGTAFTPYAARTNFYGPSVDTWQQSSASCCPMVSRNNTGAEYTYPSAPSVRQPAELLNVHPGPNGEKSVVRWTAPAAGTYKIEGRFQGIDTGGTSTDVAVLFNSEVTLFSSLVNGFNNKAIFSATKTVKAGDIVEFIVGYGVNSSYNYDSTGLAATLTPVYDAVAQFSTAHNPTGPWSYGYQTDLYAPMTLYGSANKQYGTGLFTWSSSSTFCCPMVTRNTTSTTQTYAGGVVVQPPELLNVHPGPNGEKSVVRWTAPAAGTYKIEGVFEGIDNAGTSTDVAVLIGASATPFRGSIDGYRNNLPFSLLINVAAGESVKFVVGVGGNGNYSHDSTGLKVTLTPAVSYDAAADFSATQNPAGPWSYGYTAPSGTAFTPYAARTNFYGPSVDTWQQSSASCCPMVSRNNTGAEYTYPSAPSVRQPAELLNVHPGPNGEKSVVRWTAPAAGTYKIEGRFQGIDTGGTSTDVAVLYNTNSALFSGDLNGYGERATFSVSRSLHAGDVIEFVVGYGGNGNYSYDSTGLAAVITPANYSPPGPTPSPTPTTTPTPVPTSSPFRGVPFTVPSQTPIEAEDFDRGGHGAAYIDTEPVNQGGYYRTSEGVDIGSYGTASATYGVGWVKGGEWLKYTINVTAPGTYQFQTRIASNGAGGTFHVEVNGLNKTGAITIPNTGGWGAWQTVTIPNMQLNAGQQVMRVVMGSNNAANGGFVGDFDFFRVLDPNVASAANFSVERLDPRNRTGEPGVDMLSGNYNWDMPVVSLAGRAGLDLGLSLVYNSLTWTQSQDGKSIKFDADKGFPSAGFRLGFPVIQAARYFNAKTGKHAFLMIFPSGARAELRQTSTANIYEAADSSYLQLTTAGDVPLYVLTADGTRLSFASKGDHYSCTQIKDRNGNYISIAYDAQNRIASITDTVHRVLTFNYDSGGTLASITQPWSVNTQSLTHEWAVFEYENVTVQASFGTLLMVGAQNGQSLRLLKRVRYADGSKYEFTYNTHAQVNRFTRLAADGHILNYTQFDAAPIPGAPGGPRVNATKSWAENWNGEAEAVTSYQVALSQPVVNGEAAGTMTLPTVAARVNAQQPSLTLRSKEYFAMSGWRGEAGLTLRTETLANNVLKKRTTAEWTQDDETLTYQQNPRPKDIIVVDGEGNRRRRTHTVYYPASSFSLPMDVYEYGTDDATPLRRSHVKYNLSPEYTSRRIIGLASERHLYDGQGNLVSKATYEYDLPDSLRATGTLPTQHDGTNFGTGLVAGRGNLCRIRRWDTTDGRTSANLSLAVAVSELGYNTTGARIFERDALGHETTLDYADARNTFAYPTAITNQEGHTFTAAYNYDLGVAVATTDPKGARQTITYDGTTGRIVRSELNNGTFPNNSYKRWSYPTNQTVIETFSKVDVGMAEIYSASIADGAGRVIGQVGEFPGSEGEHSGRRYAYDVLGRVIEESNPAEVSIIREQIADIDRWEGAGDDAGDGLAVQWQWSRRAYDWMGRPTSTTSVNNARQTMSYDGCGCAGGNVVTFTDEVGRRQKSYADSLGREIKIEQLNADGTIYSTFVNSYSARDQILSVRKYQGQPASDGSCPTGTCQEAVNTYDGHGRPKTEKAPAQTSPFIYAYNADDTLFTVQDARGAKAKYTYNARKLIKKVEYEVPLDPATKAPVTSIPTTPTVEFEYDSAGNRTLMKDGLGQADYVYDTWGRLTSETRLFRQIGDAGTSFRLSYTYNLAGQLKSVTDPFTSISYGYDRAGQLQSVTGRLYGGVSQYITGLQYRAWGAVKSMTYGNGRVLTVGYDSTLRPANFQVGSSTEPASLMQAEFQYYSDGRIRYARDLKDNRFDRAYNYDHVGRMTAAYTGAEARAFINKASGVVSEDSPYYETFQHNVWNDLVSREIRNWSNWSDESGYVYSYVNNRRTGWTYNANGAPIKQNTLESTYDAAGRMVRAFDPTRGTQFTVAVPTNHGHDGDGEVLRREEGDRVTYSLVSSPLGGKVVAELSRTGTRNQGYVYALGGMVAMQGSNQVTWLHYNPVTGSQRRTSAAGAASKLGIEPDPLGSDAGLSPPPEQGIPQEQSPLIYPGHNQLLNGSTGCSISGAQVACDLVSRMLRSGSAVQCPNNDCGPRLIVVRTDEGREIPIYTTPFTPLQNSNKGFFLPASLGIGTPQEQDANDSENFQVGLFGAINNYAQTGGDVPLKRKRRQRRVKPMTELDWNRYYAPSERNQREADKIKAEEREATRRRLAIEDARTQEQDQADYDNCVRGKLGAWRRDEYREALPAIGSAASTLLLNYYGGRALSYVGGRFIGGVSAGRGGGGNVITGLSQWFMGDFISGNVAQRYFRERGPQIQAKLEAGIADCDTQFPGANHSRARIHLKLAPTTWW